MKIWSMYQGQRHRRELKEEQERKKKSLVEKERIDCGSGACSLCGTPYTTTNPCGHCKAGL